MSSPPLVSIIVPVYNTSQYLKQCIDSILNQSVPNWELILIDDGSTDESGSICDCYAELDVRIRVIHQPNGGISVTRNNGKKVASGEYLYFLDSDDYIKENTLSTLLEVAELNDWPDYVRGNHEVLTPDGKLVLTKFTSQRKRFEHKLLGSRDFIEYVLLPQPFVWNGLISKELAKCVEFDETRCPREDLLYIMDLIGNNFRGVYIGESTYVYRLGVSGSLSNTVTLSSITTIDKMLSHIKVIYEKTNEARLKKIISKEMADAMKTIIRIMPRLPRTIRHSLFEQFVRLLPEGAVKISGNLENILMNVSRQSPFLGKFLVDILSYLVPKSRRILK